MSACFVSRIALGTSTFGGANHPLYRVVGGLDQAAADRIIGVALDAGINLFDTADIYADGESETMLATALGARRNDVLIATKIGHRNGAGANDVGHSRVHLQSAIDASLRRLATDRIDLLQLHAHDPLNPIEDTLRTLDDAVRAGQGPLHRLLEPVRVAGRQGTGHCGRTGFGEVRRDSGVLLRGRPRYRARDHPGCHRPADRSPVLVSTGRRPVDRQVHRSRKPTDASRRLTFDFPPVAMERAYDVIDVLEAVAARHGATVAQIALAWQLVQPAVTSTLVGARSAAQLAENVKAVAIELSQDDLQQIDAVSRLPSEYPQWYHDLSLGRRPGEGRDLGRNLGK